MLEVDFGAGDAGVAGVELGIDVPVKVAVGEAEFGEDFRGAAAGGIAEEVFQLFEEEAGADEAAVGGVEFSGEIEVVGGPRGERGVADVEGAAELAGLEIVVFVGVGGAGVGDGARDDVGEIGAAVGLGPGGAEEEIFRGVVSEVVAFCRSSDGGYGFSFVLSAASAGI